MSGSPPIFAGVSAPGSPPGSPRALRKLSALGKNTTCFAAFSAEMGGRSRGELAESHAGMSGSPHSFPRILWGSGSPPGSPRTPSSPLWPKLQRILQRFRRRGGKMPRRARGEPRRDVGLSTVFSRICVGSGSPLGPLGAPRELSAVGPRDACRVPLNSFLSAGCATC